MKKEMSFADWKKHKWESMKLEIKRPEECTTFSQYYDNYGRYYNINLDEMKKQWEAVYGKTNS